MNPKAPISAQTSNPLPWHGWAFGLFVVFMLAIATWDFLQLMEPNAAYIISQGWGESGIAYFSHYPVILRLIWGTSLVAGITAVILLFLRVQYATHAALLAAGTQALLVMVTFTFMDRLHALGVKSAVSDTTALLMSVIFAWYCYRFYKRDRNEA